MNGCTSCHRRQREIKLAQLSANTQTKLAQHTIDENTSQAGAAVFEQFVNINWNDQSGLNEFYLIHTQDRKKIQGWSKLMILLFVLNDNEYESYVRSVSNAKEAINCKAQYGYTALMIAAFHGLTSKCKVLIHNGANLNATTDWNSTALMFCAESLDCTSNFETLKLLIDSGAEINLNANYHYTALAYAAEASHLKAVEYLIEQGAKVPEDLFFIDEEGDECALGLFQMHILPLKCWEIKPNFSIAELLLKHAPLKVSQDLLSHACVWLVKKAQDYVIDVRGFEVLIERGAYLTSQLLATTSDLLRTLLQAYSNSYDRQRKALQENNITKSIIKEFGNSQESLLFAIVLSYLNCC